MKISKVETFLVRWGDVARPADAAFARRPPSSPFMRRPGGPGEASPMQAAWRRCRHPRDMAPALIGADALDHAVILDRLLHKLIKLAPMES